MPPSVSFITVAVVEISNSSECACLVLGMGVGAAATWVWAYAGAELGGTLNASTFDGRRNGLSVKLEAVLEGGMPLLATDAVLAAPAVKPPAFSPFVVRVVELIGGGAVVPSACAIPVVGPPATPVAALPAALGSVCIVEALPVAVGMPPILMIWSWKS